MDDLKRNEKKNNGIFGTTYTKQRLVWPLRKDDTQKPEVFH